MEYLPETLQKTAQLIDNQLGSELMPNQTQLIDSYEALIAQLTPFIQALLNNEFERLLHLMYRIDVSETKFSQALGQPNPNDIAPAIARLVVERQLQKIKMREKYRV
jgi:Na+-transporting methylmalonyl-CoA/oxaloacetate decarboxylase beta subunit